MNHRTEAGNVALALSGRARCALLPEPSPKGAVVLLFRTCAGVAGLPEHKPTSKGSQRAAGVTSAACGLIVARPACSVASNGEA